MSRIVVSLVLLVLVPWSGFGAARADDSVWARSVDPATGARFIPVELWTGAPWDGSEVLRMGPADLKFGNRFEKHITGPRDWTDPGTGRTYPTYRRDNRGKVQLFTLRPDGQGLGRVYDSRGPRYCEPGMKFPLGRWREGERRTFAFECRRDGRARTETVVVTMEKLDFTHDGVPHSLRFHWVIGDGRQENSNNAYTYSPGRGMVALEYRH